MPGANVHLWWHHMPYDLDIYIYFQPADCCIGSSRFVTVPVPESVSVNFCIPMLVVVEEEDGWVLGLAEVIILKRHAPSILLGFLVMF